MTTHITGHRRTWLRGQDGAVSVELVLAVPALMLLLLLVVQFAVWAHATQVADTAAAQALATARTDGGSADAGQDRAAQVLRLLGNRVLIDPQIRVTGDTTQASVEIRGTALTVVPFLPMPVRARAAGSVEVFTPGG